MKKVTRITAILLMLAMCFALAACGGKETQSPAAPSGSAPAAPTTSVAPPAPTESANVMVPGEVIQAPEEPGVKYADLIRINAELPVVVVDVMSQGATFSIMRQIFILIYDRLVHYYPDDGVYEGELATHWDTDDFKTWVFYLRDDVTFHNGDKFTSQDVVDTIGLAKEAVGSLGFDPWRNVESVRAVDEYTVEIVLTAVNADFVHFISEAGGSIVNKAARDADPIKGAWVGTGAFYVSDFVSDGYTELTRNENYWGTAPLTRQLYIQCVPEPAANTIMQLNGEVDVSLNIPPQDNDMFVELDDYIVYGFAANSTCSLTFGLLNPITSDLNFRLAVAHAVNREEIAIVSTGNWAKPTPDGAFWGDSTPFRNTGLVQREYDPELAKEYLAASSYNGEEVELMTGPSTLTIGAQMIYEQLVAIGINVRLFPTDIPTLVMGSQYGNENMQLLHFVSPFTVVASSARVMLYPGMTANRASYNNPRVNELLDKAPTVSRAEQEAIYMEIQELVYEDIPQLSLYERIWSVVTNKNVGGIRIHPDMEHDHRGIFMTVDG